MNALDKFFSNDSWQSDGDPDCNTIEWIYVGDVDPKLAYTELSKLRDDNKKLSELLAEKYEIYLQNCAEIDQLKIELEAFFQATVSVLGDDEHRGGTTERVLELCRKTVYAYLTAHPKTNNEEE